MDHLRLVLRFFIDIACAAVLCDHYHVVLQVDSIACENATAKDIVGRLFIKNKRVATALPIILGLDTASMHKPELARKFPVRWRVGSVL